MSGSSLASATNQRLDAARRLLAQGQQDDSAWLEQSYEHCAVFQLRSALNGLLQEVKASYRLDSELTLAAMLRVCEKNGIVIPVLSELSELEHNTSSWLSQLYMAYQVALECQPNIQAYSANTSELIGKGSDSGASIKLLLDSLVEVVLRFREESAEY